MNIKHIHKKIISLILSPTKFCISAVNSPVSQQKLKNVVVITVPLDLNFTLASTYSRALTPFHRAGQLMFASKGSMLASKSSMLSSKGNMLSCMILLAIEVDARVQLLACIQHHAVSRCTRARLHALVHYLTCDLNLMLADITCQAFIKCLLAILIHEQ